MKSADRNNQVPFLPLFLAALVLMPVLIVAGCTGPGAAPLAGSEWTLVAYSLNNTLVPPVNGTSVTMDFDREGRLSGTAGCNHYFASYSASGSAISVGPAGSTEMYCGDPGVMEQETAFLTLLANATSYATAGDRLTLSDARGTVILAFSRTVPPVPKPLAGTNWTLETVYAGNSVSSVIAGSSVTAVFDREGKVTGSAGCNQYFASYTLNGASLVIGQPGSTKMYCAGEGIMEQESSYLSALQMVRSYSITGDQLTLADAAGHPLLGFRDTSPV